MQGWSGIPDVYGVCGTMFAVQNASADPFLEVEIAIGKDTPWENRARWALALQSLEDTPYGSFHLCDIY